MRSARPTTERVRVPRDTDNDHTPDMARRRRAFLREKTGADLEPLAAYALEAAHDYRAALELEPGLAMPLYGLAECYRVMGDSRAADLYRQYAESRAADVREDLRTLAVRRAAERVIH